LIMLVLFLSFNIISTENLKSANKDKNPRADAYYESPTIVHHPHFHRPDEQILPRVVDRIDHYQTHMTRRIPSNNIYSEPACPCINEVKCPPCGVVFEPATVCPCAPKPHCPLCPPLSLIHEIAAKKANQDQMLASNLIGLSNQISGLLKGITRYANDVTKYEIEAKNAARMMEEASLKAQFAKKKMMQTSEKARYIAKSTLYSPSPCVGCPTGRPVNPMWYGSYNRVFPEEVPNVDKFIGSNFNTNYSNREITNQADEIAKLSEGNISVSPDGKEEKVKIKFKRKKKD